MSEVANRTDAAKGRIQLRPFLLTGLYGLVFGLLTITMGFPVNGSDTLRIVALIAAIVMFVLTARGAFSRWMAPADAAIIGSPVALALGGPGYPRLTPANMAYIGVFCLGACVPVRLIPANLAAEYQPDPVFWMLGGLGILGTLYGVVRQPRREA